MNDELDPRIRRLTADYNEPESEPDVDAVWNRVQAARAAQRTGSTSTDVRLEPTATHRTSPRPTARRRTWLQFAAAIAAVLLLGIAIGRWSVTDPTTDDIALEDLGPDTTDVTVEDTIPRAVANRTDRSATAHRLVARDYLLRTETLLTEFRLAAAQPAPGSSGMTGPWAADLLLETRLLLDSPVADSPELTRLLRDLELILAEIVQLADAVDERERREIERSLEERGVMLRLRQAVPAKAALSGA